MLLPCLPHYGFTQTAATGNQDPFLGRIKFLDETPFVTKAVFHNGMTVLINEHPMHPVVSIQMFVKSGIFDEPRDNPGTARNF